MTDLPSPDPGQPWANRVLLRVEVGSTAHGTGLPGAEDYDEQGIWAVPWKHSIGLPQRHDADDTIVYRPGRKPTERSGPGDYDLTLHSARKMAKLCATGNPSALMTLFGPVRYTHTSGLGSAFRALAPSFWYKGAIDKFLGYSRSQRERLMGVRGGKHTNRPELIEVHGYDTKYAMHMIRLGIQGFEYAQTGQVTLPVPGDQGEILRAIRRGEFTLDQVLAMADRNEEALRWAETNFMIPPAPDWHEINRWLASVFDWERSNERWFAMSDYDAAESHRTEVVDWRALNAMPPPGPMHDEDGNPLQRPPSLMIDPWPPEWPEEESLVDD